MVFTRVAVTVGEPIRIPPGLTCEEVKLWRTRLHDALEAVDDEAERRVRRM